MRKTVIGLRLLHFFLCVFCVLRLRYAFNITPLVTLRHWLDNPDLLRQSQISNLKSQISNEKSALPFSRDVLTPLQSVVLISPRG